MSERQLVRDKSARRHFTIIPNIVIEMKELSHAALRLYLWYKKVCGEKSDGVCYQSLKTLSEGCSMKRETVIKARRELERLQLIAVEKGIHRNGNQSVIVDIIDVWEENEVQHNSIGKGSVSGTQSPVRGSVSGTRGVRFGDCNKSKVIRKGSLSELKSSDEKTGVDSSKNGKPTSKKKVPSKFDNRCAKELAKIVSTKVKINKRANLSQWAQQFRLLRERDQVPKKDIKASILWYMDHIEDKYTPEAYSGAAYRSKYEKIAAAMSRARRNGDARTGETQEGKLIDDLRSECWTRFGYGTPTQSNFNKVLIDHGREPGSIDARELG